MYIKKYMQLNFGKPLKLKAILTSISKKLSIMIYYFAMIHSPQTIVLPLVTI